MTRSIFADPDKLAELRRLRDAGWQNAELVRHFGCSFGVIARHLDDDALARHRDAERKRDSRRREALRADRPELVRYVDRLRADPADIEARLAEIPRDTRSLTGRLFGDPIPGDPRRARAA